MNEYIKSDLYRYTGKKDILNFVKLYFFNNKVPFRLQVAFRLCNSKKKSERAIGNFLWLFNRQRRIIQIPRHCNIGYGLYIGHLLPIIINPTATIGNNCNISQFVTIGSNKHKSAEIGNEVYIGPSCCIVENVKIGNKVTIGAGSVVTKDIPEGATAVGNYAKVINYNSKNQNIWNSKI